MLRQYIMEADGTIREEPDMLAFAKWYDDIANRKIALDTHGDVEISTIFTGFDYNHRDKGAPILFETMIFGGCFDRRGERYHTKAEALEGHRRWVEYIKSGAKTDIEREFSTN